MILSALPIIERNTGLLHTWPWTGVIILLIICSLIIAISTHKKKYKLMISNLKNSRSRIMNYDKEDTEIWANILIWIIIALCYGLIESAILQHYNIIAKFNIIVILLLSLTTGALLSLKYGMIKLCGFVFKLEEKTNIFINSQYLLISIYGILCFPMSVGLIYGNDIVQQTSIILTVFFGIMEIIIVSLKLFQIFFNGIESILYIFLYLCTVEILPIFILFKLAFSN